LYSIMTKGTKYLKKLEAYKDSISVSLSFLARREIVIDHNITIGKGRFKRGHPIASLCQYSNKDSFFNTHIGGITNTGFWWTFSNSLKQLHFYLFTPKPQPYNSYYVFNLSFHTYNIQEVDNLIQEIYVLKIGTRFDIRECFVKGYKEVYY